MRWFKNLKIGTKLLCGFLTVILIAGVIGYVGIANLRTIEKLDTELYEMNTKPLVALGRVSTAFQRIRVNLRDVILDNSNSNTYEERISNLSKVIVENLGEFEKGITIEETRAEYKKLQADIASYRSTIDKIVKLASESRTSEAYGVLTGEGRELASGIDESIQKLFDLEVNDAAEKSDYNTATAKKSINTMTILLIAGLVLGVAIAFMINSLISKPVIELQRAAGIVAAGNLTVDIHSHSKDEVGSLADAFRTMVGQMRDVVAEIVEKSRVVSESSEDLSASSQQTAAGANETSATMTEISATVEEVNASIQDISASSETTMNYAGEGSRGIKRLMEQMESIARATNDVAGAINGLSKKSLEINQIVDFITGIADQTNLLALNAAIEAARAGEQGRGFAVVAEEVRKLAEQSASAAKEINTLINSVQSESQNAVKTMTESAESVNSGNKVAREVGDNFKEIITSVQGLSTQIQEVASATEQMAAGIQSVAAATQEQTASVEEISATAESLAEIADQLMKAVKNFKV